MINQELHRFVNIELHKFWRPMQIFLSLEGTTIKTSGQASIGKGGASQISQERLMVDRKMWQYLCEVDSSFDSPLSCVDFYISDNLPDYWVMALPKEYKMHNKTIKFTVDSM